MRWCDKVTEELITDFKNFSFAMVQKFCGSTKIKLNKDRMNKLMMTSQCRGGVSILDDLLILVEKEEKIDRDFILGNIHLMRMNLWNEAATHSDGTLKKIEIETAMQVSPDIQVLLSPDKMKKVQNVRL